MGLINNLQRYGEGAEKPRGTEKLSALLEGAATRTQKKSSEKRAAPEKQWPPFRRHKWCKVILQRGSCTSLFFSLLLLPGWASPLAKCNWSASAAEDSRGWVWGTNGDNQDSALHTTSVEMERQKNNQVWSLFALSQQLANAFWVDLSPTISPKLPSCGHLRNGDSTS